MLDRFGFWAVQPRQMSGTDLSVSMLAPVPQVMISGDLEAACAAFDLPAPVGLLGQTDGPRAAIRLARHRMLGVGVTVPHAKAGLGERFATTPATGSLAVLQIEGARSAELLCRATAADLSVHSPSAAILFAGVPAVLYRHAAGMRMHLDRGLAEFVFDWVQASGALEP